MPRNWEEFVAKKQIEQDKQELMNCPCIKRGILRLSTVDSNSRFTEQSKFFVRCERILRFRNSEQLWLYYSASQSLAMPRFWIAARYTNDYLLEKDELLLSSTFQRISHPLLKNGDLTFQEIQSDQRVKWDENCRIRQHLYHASKVEVDCKVILVELILTVVWLIDYPRLPISELHLGKFSWLYVSSKLKSQLQDWSMFEISRSSSHKALDHRSWNTKVNWEELMTSRSIFGAKRFPILRYARSDDCVCTRRYISEKEKVSKSSARKNTIDSKEGDKLLTWSTSSLEFMEPLKDSQICSQRVYRMTTSTISTFDGIKHYYPQATCLQMWSWKDCTSQNHRILLNSRLYLIKKRLETMESRTVTYWWQL